MTQKRKPTRPVYVRDVQVGGGSPIVVQSMTSTDTHDAHATLAQIAALKERGCELIRVAVPRASCLESFRTICAQSPLPVIADIHFDARLAHEALKSGADALRINPGNIGSFEVFEGILEDARTRGVPIRIGVNAGSLDNAISKLDLSLPEKLTKSAEEFVSFCYERDFYDVVVSAKAHSVPVVVDTYRLLADALPEVPLHLGVTEAGTLRQGSIKNAIGVGSLLLDGIGDTIRLSLTADPLEEIDLCWDVLAAVGLRRKRPELVSCPTCGRCSVDLIDLAEACEKRLSKLDLPISVAVMGCEVNGPGEARDADIGIACSQQAGTIFVDGKPIKRVPSSDILNELFSEIEQRYTS